MWRLLFRRVETLWTLFSGPLVWALHFLACYILAAIYCEKPEIFGGDFDTLRTLIVIFTAFALAMIVLSAILAWRQCGFGLGDPPHDEPTRGDRLRFQGYATFLLSGLSFLAVIFTALPLVFIAGCQQ